VHGMMQNVQPDHSGVEIAVVQAAIGFGYRHSFTKGEIRV
jgi:hypothetical protein